MTREEAKALLGRTALLMFEHNGSSTLDGDKTLHIIDKIFDEHEAQLKAKDKRIREFEDDMKQRTCDTCTYFDNELWGGDCLNFGFRCTSAGAEAHRPDDGFCCNRYKAKDNA